MAKGLAVFDRSCFPAKVALDHFSAASNVPNMVARRALPYGQLAAPRFGLLAVASILVLLAGPTAGQPLQAEVEACIERSERAIGLIRSFRAPGAAVCPAGGCPSQPGDCNRRIGHARHEAPEGYYLDSFYYTRDTRYGGVDGLRVTKRDAGDHILAVSVRVACDPPDEPGAEGGWSRTTIVGNERLRNAEPQREEIRASCEVDVGR